MTSFFDPATITTIRDRLLQQHETIAVAESVTSGLVQAALSTAPDAALFYQGGLTTYNLGQKTRHLLIDPIHAISCNCVSEQVAKEMALGVCKLFSSDWGLAITGYASPVPESGHELFAYFAIARGRDIIGTGHIKPEKKEEPFNVQHWYAVQLLKMLAASID